jgi:CubicO group peptidase (beta-lactamase class C family)
MNRRQAVLSVAMILPALFGSSAWGQDASSAAPPPNQIEQRIDAYLRPFVEIGHLSGYLLVARGKQVVFEKAFGMANYELRVPNGPQTKFNVASVTKPMTKIVLIRLLEQGKLGYGDPLSKWIPDFPSGDKITVEHLARHRAGIPHRLMEEHDETVPRSAEDMVEFAKRKSLTFEPGERHSYSSGGYSVLARVLELAGGGSYAELLHEWVFDPVGMRQSAHTDSRSILLDRASGYLPDASGKPSNARLQDLSFLVGAGSVFSTARDLHTLLEAVRSGALGESVKASFVDEQGIEWNGVANGYRAYADWHRETDVTVVFTGNHQTGAANWIRRDVPRIAAGESVPAPVPPAVEPVTVAEDALRRYEGEYELRPGSRFTVHIEQGVLRINDWTLVPTGERTFFSPQDYAMVEVVLDDRGRAERLDWTMNGETQPLPRVDE